jgi:hypothetical protein
MDLEPKLDYSQCKPLKVCKIGLFHYSEGKTNINQYYYKKILFYPDMPDAEWKHI